MGLNCTPERSACVIYEFRTPRYVTLDSSVLDVVVLVAEHGLVAIGGG